MERRPTLRRPARWLARALERIPPGADVLDLGCGAGVPMTRALAAGRHVTGVDISARQLELARAAVPEATFVQADMTALDLPAASLDAVVAFYSLTHVPRADLPELLAAILGWLRPGGVLIASMGAQDSPDDVEADWLGVPMFFSHHGAKKNRALVRAPASSSRRPSSKRSPRTATTPCSCGSSPAGRRSPGWLTAGASIPGPIATSLPAAIRDAIVAQARAEYPERGVRPDRRRCAGGRRWPCPALRAGPEQGGVAVPLRDRARPTCCA